MIALIDKQQFIGLDSCTWLYSGAETPPHKGCFEEITNYMHVRGKGPEGREHHSQIENECKENMAKLLNGKQEQIAFMSNTSEIICMIAQSIGLQRGDNVIINSLEFPSGVLPWLRLKDQGVEVRVVSHLMGRVSIQDILNRVDHKTKLIVASHVSYLSGARMDYKLLYQQIKNTDTLLLLDATQSLGAIPVDMNWADFVVCSSYKWLLSTHGIGILGVNPLRTQHILPQAVGWRSVSNMFSSNRFETYEFHQDARKFELGFPSYPTIYSLNFSANLLLTIGIEKIERHILALGELLIKNLESLGYEIMTPFEPKQRAGNICVYCEEGGKIADQLRANHVYVWGGDGRFRASVHLFNDEQDIEHLISLVPPNTIIRRGGKK